MSVIDVCGGELFLRSSYIWFASCCCSIVSCIIFSFSRAQCVCALAVIKFDIDVVGKLFANRTSCTVLRVEISESSSGTDMLM